VTYRVDFSEADGVAIIRLDRPEVLNAIDLETARALCSAVVAPERSPIQARRLATEDAAEGLQSFCERRVAAFKGR
jgi:1,4-dihydroxy-2-naphthoyl-CoA synthase